MDLELESKYHYLLNDVMLVEISKLSMIIDALNGDAHQISIFDSNYLKSLNTAYLKEVNIAFDKFKKEMKQHIESWYKGIKEEDLSSDEITEIFSDIQTCFKHNIAYILDKLNSTYEDFKSDIYNKSRA